jgi:alkanesulfonate monooxygenase SsuD/methylene tetrahydromethanopterin reductase-like flavin-dependent oxidoreductase (luciferase family)
VVSPLAASAGRVPTWPEIREFAARAEAAALDSLWVFDHLLSGTGDEPPEGIHESWTVLSALAAATSRVELGQLVMCTSFRSPAVLAKMAVTADAVSGGRVTLGIGAGWYDAEYRAFGFPIDRRVSRFEEAVGVIRPLLHGEAVHLQGRFYHADGAVLLPPPSRRIPLLIASDGPRMLRLTAQHADAWNTAWYGVPDDRLRDRLAAMRGALAAEGRDAGSLRVTVGLEVVDAAAPAGSALPSTADALARGFDAHAALGVDDVIVSLEPPTPAALERLAAGVRRWRGSGAATG